MAWKRRRGGGLLVGSLSGVRGKVRAAQREECDGVRYEVDCCDGKHQVKVEDGGGGRRNSLCWDRVRSIIFSQKSIHRGMGGRAYSITISINDGGVESTSRVGCGEAGERRRGGRMVDGVKRERLREGRRLRTIGGGGGGLRVRWQGW